MYKLPDIKKWIKFWYLFWLYNFVNMNIEPYIAQLLYRYHVLPFLDSVHFYWNPIGSVGCANSFFQNDLFNANLKNNDGL
jgi:hypothetical protein